MTIKGSTIQRRFRALFPAAIALGVTLATAITACSPASAPDQTSKTPVTLKVGTLPIVDTLPLHVADTEGMFTKEGIKVELIPFTSAMERDAATTAGQIDGQLNDLISLGLLNKDGEKVKAVRTAHRSTPELAQISILVGPNSTAKTLADLKGTELAISKNSIIEYIADELIAANGLKPGEIKTVEVSKIPVRMEMLIKGQIGAVTVPEPFTTLGKKDGARVIASDSAGQLGQSIISFRNEVIAKDAAAIKSFLVAYERAVEAINANPEKYRTLLVDRAKVPDAVKDTLPVPQYPKASAPNESEIGKATKWMVGKGLLPKQPAYTQLVDSSLLPK